MLGLNRTKPGTQWKRAGKWLVWKAFLLLIAMASMASAHCLHPKVVCQHFLGRTRSVTTFMLGLQG